MHMPMNSGTVPQLNCNLLVWTAAILEKRVLSGKVWQFDYIQKLLNGPS